MCDACRVTASMPGFVRAMAVPTSNTVVRLVLTVAPIRESVVVTATRDDAPTSQVGASVTSFDAVAIARRGEVLVGDLLREAPGVAVVQNGGRGNVTSLFVRGGENNYTKVLLDGIPINEPGGTFNFGGLTTGHFERVELVRGAQSAVFGSDAMAGVLQLVTRRGRTNPRPVGAAEYTSGGYGTHQAAARVSGGTARFDYSLHAGRYQTDNRAPNNRFNSTTVSITGGLTISPALTMRLVGRIEDGITGAPGQTAFGRPDLDASFTQDHAVGGLTLEHHTTRVQHRVTYALAYSRQRSTNLELDPPYTPSYQGRVAPFEFYDFTYDTGSTFRRHQASYQGDVRIPHAGRLAGVEIFTVAVDWDGERGRLADFLNGGDVTPSRDNVGATLQHQHVGARLSVASGLRVEHNASFGTAVVPRLSASLLVRDGGTGIGATRLTFNAGTGIKEPTLRQSFSLSPFDLGNPDLEAETSRTLDAGIEQRLLGDRLKVGAVWFDNVFRRQISTRTISFSPYTSQYFNVGRTEARGVELTAEAAPAPGVRLQASHTVVDSEIIDAASEFGDVFAAGRWALRRPRHSGHASIFIDKGPWSVDVGASWIGRRSDSDFSSLEPPLDFAGGHTVWRGRIAWQLNPAVQVFGRIENLSNVEYMEPLGYPAWRRTAHAGLRLSF